MDEFFLDEKKMKKLKMYMEERMAYGYDQGHGQGSPDADIKMLHTYLMQPATGIGILSYCYQRQNNIFSKKMLIA